MASSYEISQMFAQQNAMFMGHGQMAQSIGVASPPLSQVGMGNSGVGAYGMGFAPRPGGYHYGQPQMGGYGPGNSISAGIMSVGSAGITAGSMLTSAGAMAGIAGMGVASAALAPLAMAAPFMAAGGQHQGQVNSMLGSQYQFFNPMSRSGSGFTRDDSKAIGDSIRQLSHIPDLMTNVEEMTRIASRLKSSGLMQGVNSAADFQHRFKEAISTIRETAKILGTTMEEAEHFFSQSRGAGFYGKSAQLRNAVSAQFTSAVTGASVGQVLGAQQAGADMAMSFGARRGLGATAVNRIAQNIGLAQQNGNIGENSVEDVTGIAGPEGQLALAQRMFGGMMRFGDTAPGRLAMAGMMRYENGRAVGVDEDMAKRFNQGLIGHRELMARAGNLSEREKISFTNRRSDLIASLAGQIGPGGAYGMMKGVIGDRFGGDEEATKLVMGRLTGMSAGEIDIAGGMEGVSGDGMSGIMAKMRQRHNQQREQSDPRALMDKLKTRIRGATLGKLEQAGADIQNSIAKSIDSFFDDVVGTQVSTLTEEKARALAAAFGGSNSAEAKAMLQAVTGMTSSTLLQSKQGALRSFTQELLGGGMSERSRTNYTNSMFGTDDISKQMSLARTIRGGNFAGDGATAYVTNAMTAEGFDSKSRVEQMSAITSGLKAGLSDALQKLGPGAAEGIRSGKMSDIDVQRAMQQADLSPKERGIITSYMAASKNKVGGMDVFAQMASASSTDAASLAASLAGGSIGSVSELQDKFKEASEGLTKAVGGTAAGFVAGGEKQASAFKKVISDDKLMNVVTSGKHDAKSLMTILAAKGIRLNEKQTQGLIEAAKDFDRHGKGAEKANAAMEEYGTASNKLALGEFMQTIGNYAAELGGAAQEGSAGDAQRGLADALNTFTQTGNKDEWKSAYDKYSKNLQSLTGEARKKAMDAGGSMAELAAGEQDLAKSLSQSGKKFSGDELSKKLGISKADLYSVEGYKEGQALSADQAQKLAHLGAQQKGLAIAQGLTEGAGGGGEKDLAGVLKQLDVNQQGIATLLATLSNDPEVKGKLAGILSAMKEADAKAGAHAQPGKKTG